MPGTLNETAQWVPAVRHFADNAVLTGGPDCPDNEPIQDLADRTAWLKQQLETPVTGIAEHEAALDPHPQYMTAAEVAAALASPPGSVLHVATATPPAGWLKANGSAISRTAYSALFAVIGTTYGVGDGSTTFNLPDLRGEFIRGYDDSRGVDAGRTLGSAQKASLLVGDLDNISGISVISLYSGAGGLSDVQYDPAPAGDYPNAGYGNVAVAGGQGGIATRPELFGSARPRNVALLACIKY